MKSCKPKRPLEPVNASRFFTILSDSISQSALIQYYRLKWQGWDLSLIHILSAILPPAIKGAVC